MDPRTLIRAIRVVLVLVAVLVAMVPLLILLDLAGGGTGYGLCPGGVTGCQNPYTAAPELSIILTVGLLVVLGGLRATTVAVRRLRRRRLPPGGE